MQFRRVPVIAIGREEPLGGQIDVPDGDGLEGLALPVPGLADELEVDWCEANKTGSTHSIDQRHGVRCKLTRKNLLLPQEVARRLSSVGKVEKDTEDGQANGQRGMSVRVRDRVRRPTEPQTA